MSLEEARQAIVNKDLALAEATYTHILTQKTDDSKLAQQQELAAMELGKLYRDNQKTEQLVALIAQARANLGALAKSKMAKILKLLIEMLNDLPNALDLQIQATKESIEWALEQKLSFLRQTLQLKLAALLFTKTHYSESVAILSALLSEYKKLDDKSSLVEVQLLEAKNYHALRNLAKARASLTSARTSANSIFCPTLTQAELDCMSGILNAEDKDYKTAFSYFYEAFEGFHAQNDGRAVAVLKYMLLSKIMLNLIDEVNALLGNKNVVKYTNREIEAMKAVATAYSNRSLKEFETALSVYGAELKSDQIIRSHFSDLYDTLLEQNLVKVIEPFSTVEIDHIAKVIGLDIKQVEGKLSQMILDKVFYGVLDQGNGWLVIYDKPRTDATYAASLDIMKSLSSAVDLLYEKAATLN
ncbi:hypothetical protein BABINDRAFT_7383 [Babjeviella inositovora NRRL Y-12698]|uniref:PCI domain-containing protein n=1 Tax=Babjeviella inositovora NRRL Y-12698 TaxID=984486 RepID=A0A1E3QSJ1_9ASCO|nr:uncharacterized protein BABINDRAFT_7383 [Babjeviella inositovora NRRL Y-12698]ODQ80676.1 hypothetical protein BABINDRAFT_7383 [Babjeviella inositovora NRRL Y-12698]